ncbi:MAG: diacylglycerol kinase [Gammaproteobacteria bacterium]
MQPAFGFKRISNAVTFSCKGIASTWKGEAAFREEVLAGIIMFPGAFFLGETLSQTALLIIPLFMVLIVELLNTGIEHVVDRIGLEHHELSGLAKDAGSAAVFLCNILIICVWSLVALDRFIF